MKLLHLTDIHLTAPGTTLGGRDPGDSLDRALDHALARHGDAEALIVTGDLSDTGDPDDYARLRDRIRACPLPVHLAIGNHDDRAAFLAAFPGARDAEGFAQAARPLSRGTALILDTLEPGTHAGGYCAARAAWLDARLGELGPPVWAFLHHHPAPIGIPALDRYGLRDEGRLGDVLDRHPGKVAHLFHGHCHMTLSGSFRGIPVTGLRSTNHAVWPDFADEDATLADLWGCYGVILAGDDGATVHQVEFGYPGPFRSE